MPRFPTYFKSMSVDHYENFPVASWLLPRHLRDAVRSIYYFARYADDVADEGDMPATARLAQLAQLDAQLETIRVGAAPSMPIMQHLATVIHEYALPIDLFSQLLSAFRQDVIKTRYENMAEVIAYCRRSANPIGRLLLILYNEHDSRALAMSDGICTALQLINFLQDIAIDWQKGRVYLPQDELMRFGIQEEQFAAGDIGGAWTPMMHRQIERARRMLQAGAPLAKKLPGRLGMELKLMIVGGERILLKLHDSGGDVFRHRPVLKWHDWLFMGWRAMVA